MGASLMEAFREATARSAARLLAGQPPRRETVDAEAILSLLLHHKLGPLGSWRASRSQAWRVRLEGEALKRLDATVLPARIRRMMVVDALGDALDVIGDLRPVLFKGLAAAEVYPEPHLRDPGDLDLLLTPEATDEAVRRLEEAGWRIERTVHSHLPPAVLRRHGIATILRHPRRPVVIDLHRALVDRTEPFRLDSEAFLAHRRRLSFEEGLEVDVPEREEHLMLLALHSVRHGHFRLGWSLDVHLACELWMESLDPERLAACCRRGKVRRAVRVGLEVARALYGTRRHPLDTVPMDRPTYRAIRRRSPGVIARGHLVRGRGRRVQGLLDLLEGPGEQAKYLFRLAFPPRDLLSDEGGNPPGWGQYVRKRVKVAVELLRGRAEES
ncbi:MAG TPA: hypothetical protein ENI92_04005 [Bacteroidetes bacterium]|nr:hypothetical protein [Bacteroidota bacterium]